MSAELRNKRILYFDHLRVLATFAVILIHVAVQNWYDTDPATYEWQIFNLYDSVFRWGVPIFLMISGALFLDGSRKAVDILKKNVLRIVTAYLFWSAVYTAYSASTGAYSAVDLVIHFVLGHFHLWFLYAIAGLYLAVPLLRKIVESEEITKYFLAMAFVFTSLIPQAAYLIGIWIETGQHLITEMLRQLELTSVTAYAFYFVLGYYLHTADITPVWRKRIYAAGIFAALATVVCSAGLSLLMRKPLSVFYEYNTVNVACMSIAVFVFAKYHLSGSISGRYIWLLQKMSNYSFGAYLSHMLMIYLLNRLLRIHALSFDPLLAVPVVSLIALCLSYGISGIVHQIPVLKKYIV